LAPRPILTGGTVQCPTLSFSEQASHPSQMLWRQLVAHMALTPSFQLIKRSYGTFNPFLMSLFPWSCCCSGYHSVYVTTSRGDSGLQPLLGSGGDEPRRPCSHRDAWVQAGQVAGNKEVVPSWPSHEIQAQPLCPRREQGI